MTIIDDVVDWANDFDIFHHSYVTEPEHTWDQLRERCPIAFTERRNRAWLPVRYDDIAEIAHDVETFSSRDVAVVTLGRRGEGALTAGAPPISSDPPVHTWARRLLLPAFGPSAIGSMTPITRALANELIDGFIHTGRADAAADYAQHIPVRIIATMLGIPVEHEERFTGWVVKILQEGFHNIAGSRAALDELIGYFAERIAEPAALARRICRPGVSVAMASDSFFRPGAAYFDTPWPDKATARLPALRAPYEAAGCRVVLLR